MGKKIKYKREERTSNEKIYLTEAYRVYALNNNLPAYDEKQKDNGDYYIYLNESGHEENREASATFDEMIAKIISIIFEKKYITVSRKIVNSYIAKNDANGLGGYLAAELENDLKIEVLQIQQDSKDEIVLRFSENNVLDMSVGSVIYDQENEIHVAFGRVRRAMYDIAEGFCK